MENPIKLGFLFLPPNSFLRKAWLKRYCALYNASNEGIQRIEIFDTEDAYIKQSPAKIVPLTDCWKVTSLPQKHQPNVFEVRTKTCCHQFSADTFQEMSEWLQSLQSVAFNKNQMASSAFVLNTEEKQEENLLYSSMDEPELFYVKAVPTEAGLRNDLKDDYILIVTTVNFSIAVENSSGRIGRVILTWPYRHIRRYGCSTDNFSFEAGRKCSSGEGLFTFSTNDALKIFQNIDSHVSALKRDKDVPSSPSSKVDPNNCFASKDSLFTSVDLSTNSMSENINKNLPTDFNKKYKVKSLPPFRKPPRKSKSNFYDSNIDRVSPENIVDTSNQYAEINPTLKTHIDKLNQKDDILIHNESTNLYSISNISDVSGQKDLSINLEHLRLNEISEKNIKVHEADYENCFPYIDSLSRTSKSFLPSEHTYGKLSFGRQSVPAGTVNAYGSILNKYADSTPSHVYYNTPHLNKTQEKSNKPKTSKPDHFIKNDVEYAQVLKQNKHSL